jgi:L-threonylcarbamoyladenylate synthase
MFLRDNLPEIVAILQNDGIICYPTDTIWGIGCDATNEKAVEKISSIKNRPPEKGYVVLVSSLEMLRKYTSFIPPRLETLLDFHVRPISIIYEADESLPKSVVAPDGTVAVRIVKDDFCCQLIEMLGKPLISSSANVSGEPFPKNFGAISSEILQKCDYVVRHRQRETTAGEPSTVARLDEFQELEFLRG